MIMITRDGIEVESEKGRAYRLALSRPKGNNHNIMGCLCLFSNTLTMKKYNIVSISY